VKNILTMKLFVALLFFPVYVFGSVELGLNAYSQHDYKIALKELKPFADKGDAQAMYALAEMYFGGLGTNTDKDLADDLYIAAAMKGHVSAQYKVGLRYINGTTRIQKDYKKAFSWLSKAAQAGESSAQYDLAIMYLNGEGVNKDLKRATEWFEKAAFWGHVPARYNYGYSLATGRGIKQNIIAGTAWILVSFYEGYNSARKILDDVRVNMTNEQIKQVREIAARIMAIDVEQRNSTTHPDYKAAEVLASSFNLRLATLKIGDLQPLTISFYSPELADQQHLMSPDKKTRVIKATGKDGFSLSVYSEKESDNISSNEACRKKYWEKEKDPLKDKLTKEIVISHKHMDLVLTEYLFDEKQGRKSEWYNGHAFFYNNGRCIDVHASQIISNRASRAVVASMLSTILYK